MTDKFWDFKAKHFPKDPDLSGNLLIKLIERYVPVTKGMRILDIGCGTGRYCHYFAAKGAEVTGFDISEKMIDIAKDVNEGLDVTLFVADFSEDRFDPEKIETFDLAIAPMTPALATIKDLDRMCNIADIGALSKHIKKESDITRRLRKELKRPPAGQRNNFKDLLDGLWEKKLIPFMVHEEETWTSEMSVGDYFEEQRMHLSKKKPLTKKEEDIVKRIIGEYEENGKIKEETEVVNSALLWKNDGGSF